MKLSSYFNRIASKRVLVIGDFLLDTYTKGHSGRISPEAPVAVVNVEEFEQKPGGAGNVVLNLVELGAKVTAVGRIGEDPSGSMIKDSLARENVDCCGLVVEKRYQTPVKNRIISESQQIVRVDYERLSVLKEQLEQEVIEMIPELASNVDAIAISDYGKGFLTRTLLQAMIEFGRDHSIPVITDPKGIDFSKYEGSTIIKPNLSEAVAVAGGDANAPLDEIAKRVLEKSRSDYLIITRSKEGISLFSSEKREDYPVSVREVKDVTGAGDTVLAMLTYAIANGIPYGASCQLANIAAGVAIEHLGCARVKLQEIAHQLLLDDTDSKVFDENHLSALYEVLKEQPKVFVSIDSKKGFSRTFFESLRQLKGRHRCTLVVHLSDREPCEEFVHLLSSHHDVDYVVQHQESFMYLCSYFQPNFAYHFDQDDLRELDKSEMI